nr:DUF6261 family protein [Streptococcus loxodontisalivarius]
MKKKIYDIQSLTLSVLDSQEFAQLMTESAEVIKAFTKKAKPELTYVSKLALFEPTLDSYKASLHQARKSQTAANLSEADRERDEALLTLFRLHKAYALVKTPATKTAYEGLAQLFNNYKGIAEANYEKETESINHLLKKLAEPNYQDALTQLNLTAFVDSLTSSQRTFEKLYQERLKETEGKQVGKTKELRRQLTEIYDFFVDYTAISVYAYPERAYFAELRDQLNAIRSRYKKRKSGKKTIDTSTDSEK